MAALAFIFGALMLFAAGAARAAPGEVLLGTAGSFGVLGGQGVTNTGPTTVEGNLGTCPNPAISGFPPGMVGGSIHANDAVACQAQADTTTAYNDAAGRAPTTNYLGPTDLGAKTLVAGVYKGSDSFGLTGTLTLDGQQNPDSVFIFQAASTLITATNSSVVLVNGAKACNVFWQVGSSATVEVGSSFVGTVIALTSITAKTNASIDGRLLARNGSVTLAEQRAASRLVRGEHDNDDRRGGGGDGTTTSTTAAAGGGGATTTTSTTAAGLAPTTTTSTTALAAGGTSTTIAGGTGTTTTALSTSVSVLSAPRSSRRRARTSTSTPARGKRRDCRSDDRHRVDRVRRVPRRGQSVWRATYRGLTTTGTACCPSTRNEETHASQESREESSEEGDEESVCGEEDRDEEGNRRKEDREEEGDRRKEDRDQEGDRGEEDRPTEGRRRQEGVT